MAHDIRLLVLDIDGTLAGESNIVSSRVLRAIKQVQQRGVQVAIATGRMYCSALRFHRTVNSSLPLIAYQGAYIKDPNTQCLYRHQPLPRPWTLELLNYLKQLESEGLLSIHLYIDDTLHVKAIIEDTVAYAARSEVEPNVVGDLLTLLQHNARLETTKLLALSSDTALIAELIDQLAQHPDAHEIYLTRSVDTFFEATHPSANKGDAVRYLAEELLQLNRDQVMVIGDNFNDLEMIRYAKLGIAMANGPQLVQTAADWVAPSVDDDGVATALETFLL